MRFFENGPSIPDELLIARDEGRVVFFCGAGVSRARAKLPDFFGLAESVILKLGVPTESSVCKTLNKAQNIGKEIGEEGIISADRIFGLLERDFEVRDIELEVSKALKPGLNVDLSAHRVLLDLATTPEGKVRLVTTNFDRLFDDCDSGLHIRQPPKLPDPSRHDEMDGIIYMHGCTNKEYSGSEGDGFILSSSEFGRAYLSEGWATAFFREIIERYIVVFVGYTADDPPVHYLLEALNKKEGQLKGVYAFQSGVTSEATARWRHKGVEAIAYSEEAGHCALWETLAAWAARAKNPKKWYQSVIDLARKGPKSLRAHERGQVAHIISTVAGVRQFSEDEYPPSAEWLCVFDCIRRYAVPGYINLFSSQEEFVDPFDLYGLDFDFTPTRIMPDDLTKKRDIPSGAWDAFTANRLDHQNLRNENYSSVRGHWSTHTPLLPSRLLQIGAWISKVADQPASVWWAASQTGLHPDIQQQIKWELERSQKDIPAVIRQAWRYLFEAWKEKIHNYQSDWYELKAMIDKDGWGSAAIRKFVTINRPYLKAAQNPWCGPLPPERNKDFQVGDLLHLDVFYPTLPSDAEIPDEWLTFATRELRKNLEHALQLETELGGYGLSNISPIVPDEPNEDQNDRTHRLSGSVISFTYLFERLIKLNISIAQQEFAAWPLDDDTIFARLRIWACGFSELVSLRKFDQTITGLSDDAFWDSDHQRDLLLVLAKRWCELPEETIKRVEIRLLNGRTKREDEEDEEYEKRKAWAILNRLIWLEKEGCDFSFDLEAESNKLQKLAINWKPEYGEKAANSVNGPGVFVRKDTEHTLLLKLPLNSILSKALEMSGSEENYLVEKDPFAGLLAEYPVRAFSVLTNAARINDFPEWAWRKFLNSEGRKNDKPRFSALIAERLSRYPDQAITDFIYPASTWVSNINNQLASQYRRTFDKVIAKLINVLQTIPTAGKTGILRGNKQPDWAMDAINSPVGKIAQTLFDDLRMNDLDVGGGFPAEWLTHVTDLLSLEKELRCYAIVTFSHNLNWFYDIDPNWTETNLISPMEGNNEDDINAFWSGLLWNAKVPRKKLYLRIKSSLLMLAKRQYLYNPKYCGILASIILAGWGSKYGENQDRFLSNDEMRDLILHTHDGFRIRILSQIESWSVSGETNGCELWAEMLPEFFQVAWPRQKSVKTSAISAGLFNLAISNTNRFPVIAEIILPLLTTITHEHLIFPRLRQFTDNVVDKYPNQALDLLCVVLPDNIIAWPFNIEEILDRISEANSLLHSDARLLELKRKWNAR